MLELGGGCSGLAAIAFIKLLREQNINFETEMLITDGQK
jgi:hypothetical protein